jgi:glycosyltransferase involved in cell wall biosynthesis
VRNEAETVEPLLKSIGAQTRRPDECIIVDDGSSDGTPELIEELCEQGVANVRTLRLPPAGAERGRTVSRARNAGIAEAASPIIALADAGTVLADDWLEELTRPFAQDPSIAISGGFFEPGGRTWLQRCIASVITPQIEEIDPERFLPVGRSMAFRRDAWERVGGFPDWVGNCEDLMFDFELRRDGARFGFAPDASCTWDGPATLRDLFEKYFSYARGDGHGGLWLHRHLIRYGAYAAGAALAALALQQPLAWIALAAGFLLYARKFHVRLRRRPPGRGVWSALASRALLPMIMITGDVAKMTGYPVGLLRGRRHERQSPGPGDRRQSQ